jgi:methionyl-tRNA formyltransferase
MVTNTYENAREKSAQESAHKFKKEDLRVSWSDSIKSISLATRASEVKVTAGGAGTQETLCMRCASAVSDRLLLYYLCV